MFLGFISIYNKTNYFRFRIFITWHKISFMAKKGHEKNTKNKAKHAKLMGRKKKKIKSKDALHKSRLKAIVQKAKEQQKDSDQL